MKASAKNLLSIIKEPKQFVIPIYQRTYSWQPKQCVQILKDIKAAADSEQGHFIGSIVYFQPDIHTIAEIHKYLVIDGQQRLTTITLLIAALVKFLEDNSNTDIGTTPKKLNNYYLFNTEEEDELYYKLLLTKRDKETLKSLLSGKPLPEKSSTKVIENFEYFYKQISAENASIIYQGLQKLIVVDVALEREKDNPQLIFESLNSTGLNLSQADLIRNYILMGQESDFQKHLYEQYWYPMEQSFGENITSLPFFMRDYLTMKMGSIPNIDSVYEKFKTIFKNTKDVIEVEAIVKDLYRYSQYYVRVALRKETDTSLLPIFKALTKLKMDTSYPFLIAAYSDYEDDVITKDDFKEILNLTKNYVFRRAIVGIPTNSLNKTFATFYKNIKRETYLESVKAAFLLLDSYKRFPDNVEFEREIKLKDVYNFRSRNYLLESLENYKRKELVNAENYTIEHIIPQNEKVSVEWKQELGENWKSVKETYLHTLGNLSLTAYNSELSDHPFSTKKSISGGFNDSPLFLNQSVRSEAIWNEEAINTRAATLAQRALKVWTAPVLDETTLAIYQEPEQSKSESHYSLDDYDHLQGDMLELYKALEKRVLNIDSSVRVEFKKLYIAFKSQTNFVDVVPQKKRLRLSLNIEFDQIRDPNGICKDVSGLGRWGNGDVEVGLENSSELDYIIELIEQAFEIQVNE
ncbi:DUF262 and DUF1524 domain-containing protein [Arcticibacterium luteifluviistationis]|uniref:DUF262 domain-containing protein n=1 Tax=Arcticibacterium luteifluviistationis TaxID=1784714 RepID=A0A2Z4GC24_9BACT|nr:DUF262 and DUF1524 domain-containing protein [Arcticibacterium luteifluviistationis]AWV98483.1 hypothetical protein DJ013_09990 [Arcticibacterium luteifluviistationis]